MGLSRGECALASLASSCVAAATTEPPTHADESIEPSAAAVASSRHVAQ